MKIKLPSGLTSAFQKPEKKFVDLALTEDRIEKLLADVAKKRDPLPLFKKLSEAGLKALGEQMKADANSNNVRIISGRLSKLNNLWRSVSAGGVIAFVGLAAVGTLWLTNKFSAKTDA